MTHKTLPLFTTSFSRLSEAAALKLRIEQTKAFKFSEQTAKALAQARADKTPESVTLACRLAASELQGSRELQEVAKTLSLCFALPVSSLKERVSLAYPIFGAGLGRVGSRGVNRAGLLDLSEAQENAGLRISSLRYEDTLAPLARSAWLSLLGSRGDQASSWLSVEGPTQGLNPIHELHSGRRSFEESQGSAKNGRGYHHGQSESYDSGPMVRAFTAHAQLMSRLLGDEPGPGSLYELARELMGSAKPPRLLSDAEDRNQAAEKWERRWTTFKSIVVQREKAGLGVSNWLSAADERARLLFPMSLEEGDGADQSVSAEARASATVVSEELNEIRRACNEKDYSTFKEWGRSIEDAALFVTMGALFEGEVLATLKAARGAFIGFDLKQSELSQHEALETIGQFEQASRLIESLVSIQEIQRKFAGKEKNAKVVSGLSDLFEQADSALLGAVEIAKRREEAAFEAMGLEGSAKALRKADLNEESKPHTMVSLGEEQELEKLRNAEDPLQKMLLARARIGRAIHHWGNGQDGQAMSLKLHMRAVASKEELEGFCSSKAGEFYIEALETGCSDEGGLREAGIGILYLACLREFRNPSEPGDALFDSAWKDAALKMASGSFHYWDMESVKAKTLKAGNRLWEAVLGGSAESWSMIVEALGEKEGFSTIESRVKAANAQCAEAARAIMDKALGKPLRDREITDWLEAPLKKGRSPFYALPYGFAPDEKIRAYFGGALKEAGLRDPEATELLKGEGFAGEMAMGAQEFYQEIPMREGANARSRANAWLAAGKRLCREQLGLSEAGYRLAKDHARAGKRVAGMLGPILKERAAARATLSAPLQEAKSRTIEFRRGSRLTRLLGQAAGSGAGPEAAFAVSEAITPGRCSSGDLELSEAYIEDAMEPMQSGASPLSVIHSLRREAAAQAAFETRFDAALLERAQEMVGKAGAGLNEAQAAKAQRQAIKDLKLELELVEDWASDSTASFFTQLPPKLRWADLRRGQQAWHEEALKREADNGSGWKAALGSWSDPASGWSAEELLTPLALSEEGKAMRHCVGGYSSECSDGSSRIFSLKKNGVRALTAQFQLSSGSCVDGELPLIKASWRLSQNRGPCNASPNKAGDAATEALKAALQNAWDARVEQALANPPKAAQETEIAGFNPDMALDLSKWKRNKEEKAPKAFAEEALNGLARK